MIVISDFKKRRIDKGKTQKECADDTKIPLRTIQRYENGDPIGDSEYLCRLMCYFEILPIDLLQKESK